MNVGRERKREREELPDSVTYICHCLDREREREREGEMGEYRKLSEMK